MWGGVLASTFAMPNSALEGYQYAARVFSAFFILLQLVILLDFIYQINEYLLERDHCAIALVALTALLIAGTCVGMGFLYKVRAGGRAALRRRHFFRFLVSHGPLLPCPQYWAPNGGCDLNIFFITWTLVLFLGYGALSVSPWRAESAGLMTSAAVFAYCMYYTWSALQSEPRTEDDGTPATCVPAGSGGTNAIRIISFVLALLAVSLTTTNSGRSSAVFSLSGTKPDAGDDGKLAYRPDFFYLTFMLASGYVGMVLTGWGIDLEEQGEFALDQGWGSVWAKMAASWVCAALYTWTLVAPRVLAGREF